MASSLFDLTGKSAVAVGGTSGIGNLVVLSGGTELDAFVTSGGRLYVSSGGTAINDTVSASATR